MLKMILVDDEKMERTCLRKYIDWRSLGIEIVGEASGGETGLAISRAMKPDIIITDIKMMNMDGLEFARQVKMELPSVKIVFISGHEDFDYARTAVDLNAYGYILKPYRVETVIEVVRNIVLKCRDESSKNLEREELKRILEENRGILKDGLIRELLDGCEDREDIWERIRYFGLHIRAGMRYVLLMEMDEFRDQLQDLVQEDKQLMLLRLMNRIREIVASSGYGEPVRISENQVAVIWGEDAAETGTKDTVQSFSATVKRKMMQEAGLSMTIGVSEPSPHLQALHYQFEQAKDAVRYKLFNLKGQTIEIQDVRTGIGQSAIDLKKLDMELVECLRLGNSVRLFSLIDDVFSEVLATKTVEAGHVQNLCVSMVCSAMRFLNEINCTFEDVLGDDRLIWSKLLQFETIADESRWLKNVFAAIFETMNLKKKSKNRLIVDKSIEIIQERYASDLTTKEIAKDIYLSPNYIGAIFKEETGMGFLEYLTKVRMEKAIEMLRDPTAKIYEIAQRVGYSNTPYFSTVFRDSTGMTPSEYREKR